MPFAKGAKVTPASLRALAAALGFSVKYFLIVLSLGIASIASVAGAEALPEGFVREPNCQVGKFCLTEDSVLEDSDLLIIKKLVEAHKPSYRLEEMSIGMRVTIKGSVSITIKNNPNSTGSRNLIYEKEDDGWSLTSELIERE